MRILLTGYTGFVGSHLHRTLIENEENHIVCLGRRPPELTCRTEYVETNFEPQDDYSGCMELVDVVIHCAAISVSTESKVLDPSSDIKKINVDLVEKIARTASRVGVERFIFLSSLKVNGESSEIEHPIGLSHAMNPLDNYSLTKMLAERMLNKLMSETELEIVIIRPPIVYGPGVKGNFRALIHLAKKNMRLPLADLKNLRSFVSIFNLTDLLVTCIDHPSAANQTFFVSDDYDVSTSKLLESIILAADKKPKLIKFPPIIIQTALFLLGKKSISQRLFCSLQVDISDTKKVLGWRPPVSFVSSIKSTVLDLEPKQETNN